MANFLIPRRQRRRQCRSHIIATARRNTRRRQPTPMWARIARRTTRNLRLAPVAHKRPVDLLQRANTACLLDVA